MASLETAGFIGSIGGAFIVILCMTAFNWNFIVSGIVGLTIGFTVAFIGVILLAGKTKEKQ